MFGYINADLKQLSDEDKKFLERAERFYLKQMKHYDDATIDKQTQSYIDITAPNGQSMSTSRKINDRYIELEHREAERQKNRQTTRNY